MSLVLVSPSTEMELKDALAADVSAVCKADGDTGASVAMMERRVAMFGWIMPAPFVMPAREKVVFGNEGSVKGREISFGNVSVVQMAWAVFSQCSCVVPSLETAVGILSRIFEIGRLRLSAP